MEAPCAQYVPTTLLLIITYLTFYFALDDFTDRIMVSLTALMVMAALFLQTNQSMPRTAYLKVVDIWFLFCIIIKFVIVLWLVVINYVRQMEALRGRKQQVPTHNGKVWTNVNGSLDSAVTITTTVITANKINFWAQLIIPTGFFARKAAREEEEKATKEGRDEEEGGREGEEEEGGREEGRGRGGREGGRKGEEEEGGREGGRERKRKEGGRKGEEEEVLIFGRQMEAALQTRHDTDLYKLRQKEIKLLFPMWRRRKKKEEGEEK
ncbi:hypothetical protein Pcinc_014056 [Petrolisthes cinctipes]|uniref:Neurotransmitter-gated ion-channel transmembrane domain-containing protein n=1 Tax=Petrolisthes cinctipes TaxID=88211 RepID=A0AAE1K2P6_PETCI|nr:hypothetical protein Pcinc_032878 [Petrolisthes cinctipes]KAK3881511.1 hypothetical protein Pcinc_014056 [Petrolisthes cinctipes]